MSYKIIPYVIAHLVTAAIAVILVFLVWKRRNKRAGMSLLLLFIAVVWWSLSAAMEAAAVTQELKVLWSQIAYIGAYTTPPLFFTFSQEYTNRKFSLTPPMLIALYMVPVFMIIAAFTNNIHGLLWSGFSPGPAGTNSIIYEHGLFFWIGVIFTIGIAFFASFTLFAFSVKSQKLYKRQNRLILLASVFPITGSLLYVSGLNPFPGLDLIPSTFVFTGLALVVGISREKLLDVNPISHEFIIENIEDAFVVLAENMQVLDLNQASEVMLNITRGDVIGQPASEVIYFWDSLNGRMEIDKRQKFEIALEGMEQRHIQVSIAPLKVSSKKFLGWVLTLEDITRRKTAELQLHEANLKLERQLSEIRTLQEKLHEQAIRDPLTGAFNRGFLDTTLERELARAARKGLPVSVLMIDIDHFKKINDTYGHKAGDIVIKTLGKMLMKDTRACDCVCRFGGDEFVVVMPDMEETDATQRAESWRGLIKTRRVIFRQDEIAPTISIGIAVFPDNDGGAGGLVDAADRALYTAKEAGRDCVRVFSG